MIKFISFFIFLIVWFLFFMGINKAVKKLSYPINKRYLNFRYIIFTFIYILSSSNSLVSSKLLPLVGNLLNLPVINSFISFIIPQRAIELIFILLCTLVLNSMFAVSYLTALGAIRLSTIKISDRFIEWDSLVGINKIKHIHWFIINKFYEENDGKVRLKNKGYTLGMYIKGMKYASVILWGIELAVIYVSICFCNEIWNAMVLPFVKRFYLLPVTTFFLFEQIQMFLEGPEGLRSGSVSSTDISEEMMGNVEALITCYQDAFNGTGALLCSEKGPDKNILPPGLMSNDTGNSQIEKCDEPGVLEIIVNQLQQSGIDMNASYQNAVIHLINGKSVFVKDNAEGEFSPYYAAFINYYISQGQRAIILCTDNDMVNRVFDDLVANVKKANGSNMLWIISKANEIDAKSSVNVVICTYHELLDLDMNVKYKEIAENIHFVVFPDSVGLIEQNNITLELLLSKLHSIKNLDRYIFISDVANNLVRDRIQQLFYYDSMDLAVFNSDLRYMHSGAMVWKGESAFKLQTALGIGHSESPYMGTALPLALLAIKNDFHRVNIIRGKDSGDEYFINSAMPANIGDINSYFDSQTDITSKIISLESRAIESEDMKIICVYDNDYNFYNALWRWFKYAGKKGTIVHVISPFYMMREFFADNYKNYINNNNEYSALLKDKSVLDYSRRAMLLALFAYCSISESDVWSIAQKYNWDYKSISELLLDILGTARDANQVHGLHDYYEFVDDCTFETNPDRVIKFTKIQLSDKTLIDELREHIAPARLELNHGNQSVLSILKGNVYNYYLRGQVFTYCGQFYKVDQITQGIVYVSPETPSKLYEYFTVSDFSINNSKTIDPCADNLQIDFSILEADVTRRVFGYVSSVNGNDFSDKSINTNITSIPELEIKMNKVPVLELKMKTRLFNNKATEAVYLLSVLLNGLFKTLFPNSYQNIFAVADQPYDEELCRDILDNHNDYSGEDLIRITTPGIHESDREIESDTVRLYVIEFSCIEYGMVNILYQSINLVLPMIYRYLNWYLESGKGRYIHYGMDEIPGLFAPQELLSTLRTILNTNEPAIVGNNDNIEHENSTVQRRYTCTFCGQNSYFAWRFGDGRKMCGNCHDHMKTQADEIKSILTSTRNRMIEYYRISINNSIDVRFQSKDAIERVAGKVRNGRILGFYDHSNQQLWIERKGPAVAMQSTMAHELTHAWQYVDLDLNKLEKALGRYSAQKRKVLLEGHAVFVQIDVMRIVGEAQFAESLISEHLLRSDAYGKGYQLFTSYYQKKIEDEGPMTPFEAMKLLVNEIIEGGDPIEWPADIAKL